MIDATRSSVNYTSEEQLAKLPTARAYQDVVNMLPGVQGRVDTSAAEWGWQPQRPW